MNEKMKEYMELCELVDKFAKEMKAKLAYTTFEKLRSGWANPNWKIDDIKLDINKHLNKGDMIDVANLAMFAWFREFPEL